MTDSTLIIILGTLTIAGVGYILYRIPRAILIANSGRANTPRQQMLYNHKTGKITFPSTSQRTAWWIRFWDNL